MISNEEFKRCNGELKLVIMKTAFEGQENKKRSDELELRVYELERELEKGGKRNMAIAEAILETFNYFAGLREDLEVTKARWFQELGKLRHKIKARVKKTKFDSWKIMVRHHRQHLIVLTKNTDI